LAIGENFRDVGYRLGGLVGLRFSAGGKHVRRGVGFQPSPDHRPAMRLGSTVALQPVKNLREQDILGVVG
jgi:hypothetical protein